MFVPLLMHLHGQLQTWFFNLPTPVYFNYPCTLKNWATANVRNKNWIYDVDFEVNKWNYSWILTKAHNVLLWIKYVHVHSFVYLSNKERQHFPCIYFPEIQLVHQSDFSSCPVACNLISLFLQKSDKNQSTHNSNLSIIQEIPQEISRAFLICTNMPWKWLKIMTMYKNSF